MRLFSYRNRRRAKVFFLVLFAVLVTLLLFCVIRFIYLQRFLVYEQDGVHLDYSQDLSSQPGSTPDWSGETVEIITEEATIQETNPLDEPRKTLSGYYITTKMLSDMDSVSAALAQLEQQPQTILVDLKSIYGNFYYSSGISGASMTTAADLGAVDSLLDSLASQTGLYLVARIASLSDPNFALANQSCGLPLRSGALWVDTNNCYWLDPMDELVQRYLVSIAQELASMGFDEIVFDDFRIPDSGNIIYSTEYTREEAAALAAQSICEQLADTPIRVSFNSSNAQVAQSSERVYLKCEDGSQVASMVNGFQDVLEDPSTQIVFLTASRDTRFDGYGILRPLIEDRQE